MEATLGLGAQLDRDVFAWSPRHGLYPAAQSPKRLTKPRTFLEGVDDIERFSGSGLFLMLDAHNFLDSVDVCRALRDLVSDLPEQQKTIVFVGTSERIPDDLRKDISVIVWPLPSSEELKALVDDHFPKTPSVEHREVLALRRAGSRFGKRSAPFGRPVSTTTHLIWMMLIECLRRNGGLFAEVARSTTLSLTPRSLRWVGLERSSNGFARGVERFRMRQRHLPCQRRRACCSLAYKAAVSRSRVRPSPANGECRCSDSNWSRVRILHRHV